MVIDDILGECYKQDVLLGNKSTLDWILSTPYAEGQKEAARERMPSLEAVKDRCFVSKKHLEYIKKLLG